MELTFLGDITTIPEFGIFCKHETHNHRPLQPSSTPTALDDTSIFADKNATPSDDDLARCLGSLHAEWLQLRDYVIDRYPKALCEWNYPGKKFGWSYRIKDKKRAIIYFLPRDRYFKVAFVFGQAAYDAIMESSISAPIKEELRQARVYAEGRGIRIDVVDAAGRKDVQQLIDIKLLH